MKKDHGRLDFCQILKARKPMPGGVVLLQQTVELVVLKFVMKQINTLMTSQYACYISILGPLLLISHY
jgi:hypothetical protein